MSKKLIAGAGVVASFAIALAPLATFAAEEPFERDTHTDHFEVTINPSCTFGKREQGTSGQTGYVAPIAATAHNVNGSEATWTTTTASDGTGRTKFDNYDGEGGATADTTDDYDEAEAYNKSVDTATITVEAGTKHAGFAYTDLTIVCNAEDGYTLKAAMANLYLGGNTSNEHIDPNTAYSATVSGYAIDSVVKQTGSADTAASDVDAISAPNGTKIAHNSDVSAEGGDTFRITYGLGVGASQKAGTYSGNVVYTLIKGVNGA